MYDLKKRGNKLNCTLQFLGFLLQQTCILKLYLLNIQQFVFQQCRLFCKLTNFNFFIKRKNAT